MKSLLMKMLEETRIDAKCDSTLVHLCIPVKKKSSKSDEVITKTSVTCSAKLISNRQFMDSLGFLIVMQLKAAIATINLRYVERLSR